MNVLVYAILIAVNVGTVDTGSCITNAPAVAQSIADYKAGNADTILKYTYADQATDCMTVWEDGSIWIQLNGTVYVSGGGR